MGNANKTEKDLQVIDFLREKLSLIDPESINIQIFPSLDKDQTQDKKLIHIRLKNKKYLPTDYLFCKLIYLYAHTKTETIGITDEYIEVVNTLLEKADALGIKYNPENTNIA
jgi:hypothetical protein